MDMAFWISPDGVEHDASGGHARFAMDELDRLEAESDDPVRSLLCRGWIRVSQDTIQVRGMDPIKKSRIRKFVRDSVPEGEQMYLEDEARGTTIRLDMSAVRSW